MSGFDEVFSYEKKPEDDFYSILGCDEHSTVEQINAEYKIQALKLHPDKNDDPEAQKEFQRLQEAKDTLTDPAKRKNYDKWRYSGVAVSYKQWRGMRDHVLTSMHWAVPKTKNRMLESCSEDITHPDCSAAASSQDSSEFSNVKVQWGKPEDVGWQRETETDVFKKFRNYQI